jgi:hypothetical protein
MADRTAALNLRILPSLRARLDAAVTERGETLTAIVERALERELDASAMRRELDDARAALRTIAASAAPYAER